MRALESIDPEAAKKIEKNVVTLCEWMLDKGEPSK
jgi:hypothetical protein